MAKLLLPGEREAQHAAWVGVASAVAIALFIVVIVLELSNGR